MKTLAIMLCLALPSFAQDAGVKLKNDTPVVTVAVPVVTSDLKCLNETDQEAVGRVLIAKDARIKELESNVTFSPAVTAVIIVSSVIVAGAVGVGVGYGVAKAQQPK